MDAGSEAELFGEVLPSAEREVDASGHGSGLGKRGRLKDWGREVSVLDI